MPCSSSRLISRPLFRPDFSAARPRSSRGTPGGIGRYTAELVRLLPSHGVDVTAFAARHPRARVTAALADAGLDGLDVVTLSLPAPLLYDAWHVTRAFGPTMGWVGGWVIIVADVVVMSNLAAIAGQYTFLLFGLTDAASNTLDVTILGVSMVETFRSSFASEVNQSGIDGLIRDLGSGIRDQKVEKAT